MSNQLNRESYFIILELSYDPLETDENVIKAAINKKQREWSQNICMVPKIAEKSKKYLSYLNDIEKVMLDPDLRKKEADYAKKYTSEKEKESYKEIDKRIRVLSLTGTIKIQAIKKLSKDYKISEDKIKKRIPVNVKVEEPKESNKEFRYDNEMKTALKSLDKNDLYEFLEMKSTSSCKALIDKAYSIYEEYNKKSSGTSGNKTEIQNYKVLSGYCRTIFNDELNKKSYDFFLNKKDLIDILNIYSKYNKKIEPEHAAEFFKKAKEKNVNKDDAEKLLEDYCTQKKIPLKISSYTIFDNMFQCVNCGLIQSDKNAQKCTNCGFSLVISCPECNTISYSGDKNCKNCGFLICDMSNALPIIQKAQIAVKKNEIQTASSLLKEAEKYWKTNQDILKLKDEIKKIQENINLLINQIDKAERKKKYYEMDGLLSKLIKIDSTHKYSSKTSEIRSKIAEAKKHVKLAKQSRNEDQIVKAYQRAIFICDDCREAHDALSIMPPENPKNIIASSNSINNSISLKWDKSISSGTIEYRLIRKEREIPIKISDGEHLIDTINTSYDDTVAIPGITYYYAVFSMRSGIFSEKPTFSSPTLHAIDFKNVNFSANENQVSVNWEPIHNVYMTKVYKKLKADNKDITSGIEITELMPDGFIDNDVKNGVEYEYLIVNCYQDIYGNLIETKGKKITCKPAAPPAPIMEINSSKENNLFTFSWTPPEKGTVHIYISKNPSVKEKEILSTQNLKILGKKLEVFDNQKATFKSDESGAMSVVPVTQIQDTCVIGKIVPISSISDVSNVISQISSDKLYLEWNWPDNVKTVFITYRYDDFPFSREDEDATKIYFSRTEYDLESAYYIQAPENKNYFFKIFSVIEKNGVKYYSNGVKYIADDMVKKSEIYYRFKKNPLLFWDKKVKVMISASRTIQLPDIRIVLNQNRMPMHENDGTYFTISHLKVSLSSISLDIPEEMIKNNIYGRLFIEDKNYRKLFSIISPKEKDIRLF